MDGVEVEVRTIDGSGWARTVGDSVNDAGVWLVDNALLAGLVLAGVLVLWLLLRTATHRGASRW